MTDPIADMLTRLRNANSAYHDDRAMPHSKIKAHIAEILKQEGYIAGWSVEDAEVGKTLTLDLKYGPNRERSIAGVRRVSKPGLRVYAKSTNLPKVLGGLGVAIISTSSGLLTDQAGRQEGRGWGSPRLRLVTGRGDTTCRASDDCPSRPGRRRRRRSTAATVTVKGPKGELPRGRRARSPSSGRGRHPRGHPPDDERELALAARPDPHAGRQHGHRRDRGLREEARDRRRRLPRAGQGLRPRVRPRLQPPGRRRRPRGHHLRGGEPDPVLGPGHRQAEGRRGRRQHPQAAQARPVQGQGRALRRRVIRRKAGKAGK
jgi:small subunit ribosomal protein S8